MRNLLMLAIVLSAPAARADMVPLHLPEEPVAVRNAIGTALGGEGAWQHARYFRFDWILERHNMAPIVRSHYWDRATGRYRVDGNSEEGAYRVYLDVKTRRGEAWLRGKKLTDAAQITSWIDKAHEAFVSDTFWLVAPYSVFDPMRAFADDPGSRDCMRIRGYRLCLDPKSHMVNVSRYDADGADATSGWSWSDWQKRGPIMVSMTHRRHDDVIRVDKLTVSETPDEAALTPPK